MLSRLKTKGDDRTTLDTKVLVVTTIPRSLPYTLLMVEPEVETLREGKRPFASLILEVCLLASFIDDEKVEMPTLSEFIST